MIIDRTIVFISKLLNWNAYPYGTATILISVFIVGAVQFFFTGILGEYILSINTRSMRCPLVCLRTLKTTNYFAFAAVGRVLPSIRFCADGAKETDLFGILFQLRQGMGAFITVSAYRFVPPKGRRDEAAPEANFLSASIVVGYLEEVSKYQNLFLCGRLAEFKYYNMDICIEYALQYFNGVKMYLEKNTYA